MTTLCHGTRMTSLRSAEFSRPFQLKENVKVEENDIEKIFPECKEKHRLSQQDGGDRFTEDLLCRLLQSWTICFRIFFTN